MQKKATLWTPANIVTCVRVVGVPVWLALAQAFPPSDGSSVSVGAIWVLLAFVVLSLTDTLDGYLARSRGEVTDFGKFLDPIADKLVVIVALCFLLEQGAVTSWALLIVIAREFLVSGLRMVVAAKGEVIAASWLGKVKTATTMVSIGIMLLVRALPFGQVRDVLGTLGTLTLWAALGFTIWSGIDYFVKAWKYVKGA